LSAEEAGGESENVQKWAERSVHGEEERKEIVVAVDFFFGTFFFV
jgi:hypothetical protein